MRGPKAFSIRSATSKVSGVRPFTNEVNALRPTPRAEWDEMEPRAVPSHPIRAHWRSWFHRA